MLFSALFALWCGEGTAICYPYGDKIWWSQPLLYTSELVFGVLLACYYIRLLRRPLHEMRNRLEHIGAGDLQEYPGETQRMHGELAALRDSSINLQQTLKRVVGDIQESAGSL